MGKFRKSLKQVLTGLVPALLVAGWTHGAIFAPTNLFNSYTFYPAAASNCAAYSSTGTTYCAQNNATGAIDYSGTDAAVVVNSAIANISGVCGTLLFKNGVYSLNSLTQETAATFSNYYAIRLPSTAASGQYCQWTVQGEAAPPAIDQFAMGVQTSGVIFNVTSTAVGSVGGSAVIMGFWTQPNGYPNVEYRNLDVRFPTNQRGNETGIDSTQALNTKYENVGTDFAIAPGSLSFPVAGTVGLFGLTSTASEREENTFINTYATGYDVDYDIESEHAVLINTTALDCNYGYQYGVRGGNVFHASTWLGVQVGECARALLIGGNLQSGTGLDISQLDLEDASSGAFAPVYHAKETNAGNTSGRISYTRVVQGVGTSALSNLFDGGNGGSFETSSAGGTTFGNLLMDGCSGTKALTSGSGTVSNACITGSRPIICTDNSSGSAVAVTCVPSAGSLSIHGTGSDTIAWAQL